MNYSSEVEKCLRMLLEKDVNKYIGSKDTKDN